MADCSACASKGGCPSAQNGGACPSQSLLAPLHPKARVRSVFAVASGKGGVGKSSITAMLAVMLARQGLRVGILDADLTGPSIPQAFGLQGQAYSTGDGLEPMRTRIGIQIMSINVLLEDPTQPVVWRGPVLGQVIKQFYSEVIWDNLDVLLLDMPPGTGDVPLTVYQSLPVDGMVMVTSPQDLVHLIVRKAGVMAEKMQVPLLGLIENFAYLDCPSCHERLYPFGEGRGEDAANSLGVPFLDQLGMNPQIADLVDKGQIETLPADLLPGTVESILAHLPLDDIQDEARDEKA